MNKVPIKFRPSRLAALESQNASGTLLGALGEFAQWAVDNEEDWIEVLKTMDRESVHELSGNALNAWRSAVARELLLMATIRPRILLKNVQRIPQGLLKAEPFFNNGWLLEQWLENEFDYAAALFPLANQNSGGVPSLGQAWAFRKRGNSFSLPENNGIKARSANVLARSIAGDDLEAFLYVEEKDTGFVGDSWQLAVGLAAKALADNNKEIILKLAALWISSGMLEDEKVRWVTPGNKPSIIRALRPKRTALLPPQNYQLWPLDIAARFANHLNTAWAHIKGEGIVDGVEVQWPETSVELHQLVGGAQGVNIATPLLFPHEKLVLWHSDNKISSEDSANSIIEVLTGVGLSRPTTQFLDSKSMTRAEHLLSKQLTQKLQKGTIVIFNVTSGNRLMSYAVESLARRHPNIWLLYKDIDVPDKYTVIIYEGDYPATSEISLPAHPNTKSAPKAADALEKLPGNILESGAQNNPAFWKSVVTEGLQTAAVAFSREKTKNNNLPPEKAGKQSFSLS